MSSIVNSIQTDYRTLVRANTLASTRMNRMARACTKTTATAALCFFMSVSLAQAADERIRTQYQYAAKVVCSLLTPHQDGDLARGTYRTAINVHNPTKKEVTFANKVALSVQPNSDPGPFSVTPFKKTTVGPDGAVLFDCGNVAGFFCPINGVCVDFAFLDGFLVIKSPVELDVVAVYTARHSDGEVKSVDVEPVQPRKTSATVRIGSDDAAQKIEKRVEYSVTHGPRQGKRICGGIAGIPCPSGMKCVDDPSDTCDPALGGADCSGICVKDSGN